MWSEFKKGMCERVNNSNLSCKVLPIFGSEKISTAQKNMDVFFKCVVVLMEATRNVTTCSSKVIHSSSFHAFYSLVDL